jgi:hypothetical protein
MEALKLRQRLEKDGEVTVTGLPCRKGDQVELILLLGPGEAGERPLPTVKDLLGSGLVGMWKDRSDIGDSSAYARRLRH